MKELPPPEPWSLAIGSLGSGFVWLSVLACLAALVLSFFPGRARAMVWSFGVGAFGFLGAFGCLITLFIKHQFVFDYVWRHSATDHELQYLFAGVWSGQQGSFLLWGLTSAIVGFFAARGAGEYRRWFVFVYALFLAGLAAIIAFDSPFALIPPLEGRLVAPPEGLGLTPSLLNYWMVIHPPTIFFGFGSLTVLFAFAVAALLRRDVVNWIPLVRPWALLSATLLGVGLCMGGFWAYETLGWGGFWMWDPVENTSFVPWCLALAFVHGMFVQQAKKKWFIANVVFAAAPFLSFCYGTFMTRSGYLDDSSVHSFAQMDTVALRFLIAMVVAAFTGFLVALFANWKRIAKGLPTATSPKGPLNRGTFYGIGNWLFYAFAFVTAFGMSVPLVQSIAGEKPKAVIESQYHQFLAWIFPPFMIAMAIAPFLNWNGLGVRELFSRITNSLAVSVGLVGVLLLWMKSPSFVAPGPDETVHWWEIGSWHVEVPKVTWVLFLTWLCLFVAVASFWRMLETWKQSKQSVAAMLSHFGVAMTMLGLIFSRGFEVKQTVMLHPSEAPSVFGYALTNLGQTSKFSDRNNKIEIEAAKYEAERKIDGFTAKPTLYYFMEGEEPRAMAWPSIIQRGLADYYFVIGEPQFDATDLTEFVLSPDPKNNPDVKAHKDVVLTYDGYEVHGSITEDGVSMLVAKMTAVTAEETFQIEPAIIVRAGEGPVGVEARIGDTYKIHLVSMDPETHAIQVWLEYIQPMYPMEVYFKPLTLFVWVGVGIMTVGGLFAAVIRRKEKKGNATETAA